LTLKDLLEQELETSNLPTTDLKNINRNIDEYLKHETDLGDDQRETFIQTIIRMMQKVSRKLESDNKYDSFIRKLYDKEKVNEVLVKIKKYNDKLIKEKQ